MFLKIVAPSKLAKSLNNILEGIRFWLRCRLQACRPANLLKMNPFIGIFQAFAKFITYYSLKLSDLGTTIFKEHLSISVFRVHNSLEFLIFIKHVLPNS